MLTVMHRKLTLGLLVAGLGASVLVLVWLIGPRGPGPGHAVSLYIVGFTNRPDSPRAAWMVITNHSNSTFRLWSAVSYRGAPPVKSVGRRSLAEPFELLPGRTSLRREIAAPTNIPVWCGMVEVSPNPRFYRAGEKLLTSRSDVVKGSASLLIPDIRVEQLFTPPRTD